MKEGRHTLTHTHTHTQTHARTHARTHTHTMKKGLGSPGASLVFLKVPPDRGHPLSLRKVGETERKGSGDGEGGKLEAEDEGMQEMRS